jgi:hypothetical protein
VCELSAGFFGSLQPAREMPTAVVAAEVVAEASLGRTAAGSAAPASQHTHKRLCAMSQSEFLHLALGISHWEWGGGGRPLRACFTFHTHSKPRRASALGFQSARSCPARRRVSDRLSAMSRRSRGAGPHNATRPMLVCRPPPIHAKSGSPNFAEH